MRGQPCACLLAGRGAGGGYPVLGFWRPTDPQAAGRQAFAAIVPATAFTAELFVLAVNEFIVHRTQPTVLVPDNASIHKAHLVKAKVAAWAAAGVTLPFSPPYSPELNRIEILWRLSKHYWLTPDAYQTPLALLQKLTNLLQTVGTPEYQITFGWLLKGHRYSSPAKVTLAKPTAKTAPSASKLTASPSVSSCSSTPANTASTIWPPVAKSLAAARSALPPRPATTASRSSCAKPPRPAFRT